MRIRFQAAPVCPSDCGAQPEHTAASTAAVTSIGRAVDRALVGVGRRSTAYPARGFVAPLDRAAETVQPLPRAGPVLRVSELSSR